MRRGSLRNADDEIEIAEVDPMLPQGDSEERQTPRDINEFITNSNLQFRLTPKIRSAIIPRNLASLTHMTGA
jgi:hypothetical protein